MYTFGDSLSDTGNILLATGGQVPVAPYYNGRFSDGPIWIDTLAAGLGLAGDATAALAGGKNYAFGGARTGTDTNPPGILAQAAGMWGPTHAIADPDALYIVAGGGNDMRDARSAFRTDSSTDVAGRQAAAAAAVSNLSNTVGFLASRGARNILVMNLPDLGATPEAALLGLTAPSSDATIRFNSVLSGATSALRASLGVNLISLDVYSLFQSVRNDALYNGGSVFGITNALYPCGSFLGSIGAACSQSLFSDALHPSSVAHTILGNYALAALRSAVNVPEPTTTALLVLGLLLVTLQVGVRRNALRTRS